MIKVEYLNSMSVEFCDMNGKRTGWFAAKSLERQEGDQWEVYKPNPHSTAPINSHEFWKSFGSIYAAQLNVGHAIQ